MSAQPKIRIEEWSDHLQAWRESGLSQRAYCQQADLKLHQFGYWRRKLERAPSHNLPALGNNGGFVPVTVQGERLSAGLTITLPNGLRVQGIDQHNLALAKQLIGLLR
jgi:hypothetical protein